MLYYLVMGSTVQPETKESKMQTSQAINYLETLTANPIPAREMSEAMFRLVRASARRAQSAYPGMAGYYDPEFEGPRAQPWKYISWPASITETIPQSRRLQSMLAERFPLPDPFVDLCSMLGVQ
jgi:hypothetical protein